MKTARSLVLASVATCALALAACGTQSSGSEPDGSSGSSSGGSGGTAASGGTTPTSLGGTNSMGGTNSSGGTNAMGGDVASGGAAGGSSASGGSSSGGAAVSGGNTAGGRAGGSSGGATTTGPMGGAMGKGGASSAGGTSSTGGTSSAGASAGGTSSAGATGTGGTSGVVPYKGVANSPKDQLNALGATWCYNWGATPKSTDCADPLFVPMVWGKTNVASTIKAIGDAGYKTVLAFNEPNKTDQSNMTVDEAIALWPTLTSNPNIRVSSPAVSDDGRAWLVNFMTQAKAKGLRVDFVAMHWYGWNAGSCTASQLEGAINWASQWNLPVWITEFGCMGSSNPDDQTLITFFNNAVPMIKKHTLVERYAWYPWNDHNHLYLPDANNVPVMTALGKAFLAAPQYR